MTSEFVSQVALALNAVREQMHDGKVAESCEVTLFSPRLVEIASIVPAVTSGGSHYTFLG